MTTLVTGATSQIGYFLLPMLSQLGEPVLALSRRPPVPASDGVQWRQGHLPDAAAGCDAVHSIVSFGPIQALAGWLAQGGAPQATGVVAVSSMSAESKRDSRVRAEREIAQRLRDGEARLIEICERRGLRWTVLRPTLIYGAGLDRSLTPIARRATRCRVFAFPAARGLRQPVHAMDVADAALRALRTPAAAGRVLPLGGGERLTVAQMFRRVRESLPVATLPLALPGAALAATARLQPFLQGPLSRLETDLVADNADIARVLGLSPRVFRPTAAAWGLEPR